jgi:hypothetical protein
MLSWKEVVILFKVVSRLLPDRAEENHENLSHDIWYATSVPDSSFCEGY